MSWRVGVDSGGTYTDVCLFDEEGGDVAVWKVSSTPDDPSRGIAQGVDEGMRLVAPDAGERPAAPVSYFGHGTTVATNALIQHKGVRTGLLTTEGFRDLLEIGRQKRPDLYDLFVDKPPTLVSRDLRLEAPERIRHTGEVETPLNAEAVRAAGRKFREEGVRSIAVCFLYSFVRPDHEQQAKRILQEECPDAFICASHEIAPEFREFERLSTAVLNAYLGPVMRGYIERLAPRLQALGMAANPHMTQSNGGVIGFEAAAALPVRTILSGPSTGVVGAQAVGRVAGFTDIITFDMGGTSTDVALLKGGQPRLASEAIVHGYPLKAPMIGIHTVGPGGGSIAHVDSGGLLKFGPSSAGADPGPVCYGRGNREPTVTDANIVLQTLDPTHLLGGRMAVRQDLAKEAIGRLARKLGLGLMETAQGILSVVTANMARAIRVISVQRGHDPRDYTMMAFAAPARFTRRGSRASSRSARARAAQSGQSLRHGPPPDRPARHCLDPLMPLEAGSAPAIERAFAALQRGPRTGRARGHSAANRRLNRTVDMRYTGQNYKLAVPMPEPRSAAIPSTGLAKARRRAPAHVRLRGGGGARAVRHLPGRGGRPRT